MRRVDLSIILVDYFCLCRFLDSFHGFSLLINRFQCDKGALDSYLQKNHLELPKKMEMCAQAAYGIEYLHYKRVIHRDIAARNCLYGNNLVSILLI